MSTANAGAGLSDVAALWPDPEPLPAPARAESSHANVVAASEIGPSEAIPLPSAPFSVATAEAPPSASASIGLEVLPLDATALAVPPTLPETSDGAVTAGPAPVLPDARQDLPASAASAAMATPTDVTAPTLLPRTFGAAFAPHPLEGSETHAPAPSRTRHLGHLMVKRASRYAGWPSFEPPLARGPIAHMDVAAAALLSLARDDWPPPSEFLVPRTELPSPLAQVCRPTHASLIGPAAERASAAAPAPGDDTARRAFGLSLARAAMAQADAFLIYSVGYTRIGYPLGDVPALYGVCTDVVIRAYRTLGIDLQELVHTTARRPGDRSIRHRRTEELRLFFERNGTTVPITDYPEDYLPGDIVTYHRPNNRTSKSHIAIVTDVIAPSGRPMVVHNRGWGVQIEDALFIDRVTGHYRYFGPAAKTGSDADAIASPQATPHKPPAGQASRTETTISSRTAWSASGPAPECTSTERAITASRATHLCAPARILPIVAPAEAARAAISR